MFFLENPLQNVTINFAAIYRGKLEVFKYSIKIVIYLLDIPMGNQVLKLRMDLVPPARCVYGDQSGAP